MYWGSQERAGQAPRLVWNDMSETRGQWIRRFIVVRTPEQSGSSCARSGLVWFALHCWHPRREHCDLLISLAGCGTTGQEVGRGAAGVRPLITLIQNVLQNSNFGMKAQTVSLTSMVRCFPRCVSVTLFALDKVSTRYISQNHHSLFSYPVKQKWYSIEKVESAASSAITQMLVRVVTPARGDVAKCFLLTSPSLTQSVKKDVYSV